MGGALTVAGIRRTAVRRARLARVLLALWLIAGLGDGLAACCELLAYGEHGHAPAGMAAVGTDLHVAAHDRDDGQPPQHRHCTPAEMSDHAAMPAPEPVPLPPAPVAAPHFPAPLALVSVPAAARPVHPRAPPARSVLDLTRRLRI